MKENIFINHNGTVRTCWWIILTIALLTSLQIHKNYYENNSVVKTTRK